MGPDLSCANHRNQPGREIVFGGDGFIQRPSSKSASNFAHLLFGQLSPWILLAGLAGVTTQASAGEIFGSRAPLQIRHIVVRPQAIEMVHVVMGRWSGADPRRGNESMNEIHSLLTLRWMATIILRPSRQLDVDVSIVFAVASQFTEYAAISGDEIIVVGVHWTDRNHITDFPVRLNAKSSGGKRQ